MYQDLRLYVDFNWEQYSADCSNYFFELYRIIELAYQHKATVFCSERQVQELKIHGDLDKNFSQSHGNKLDLLLNNTIKKNNNSYFFEICFADKNTLLNHVDNAAISIIEQYSKNALISISSFKCTPLLSIKSATDFEIVNFKVISTTKELLGWIKDNSTERKFNLSSKHGESGRGNQQGQSVLCCTKSEAQQLLDTAIPDFSEKEKQLFNYDDTHHTYIEFFYEGDTPQNQWHGFHIIKDEWDKRIPRSIREYFGK